MRLFIYIVSLFIATAAAGQFEQFENKGKVGFKHANAVVKKAKYDSLVFGDEMIVTAYKKEKVFYINSDGKIIHKGQLARTTPFLNGTGILKNKKGNYALLKQNGEYLIKYLATEKPLKYGQMVFLKQHYITRLYNANELLETGVDSVNHYGEWLLSFNTTKETYTYYEKRRFLADKKVTGTKYHSNTNLYHAKKGELKTAAFSSYKIYSDNLLMYKAEEPNSLYSLDASHEIENISQFEIIDSSYFTAMHNAQYGVYSFSNLSPIISGAYDLFLLKSNTIYALGDTTNNFPSVDIYDYSGELLKTDLQFVRDLDENRFIFARDSLQFIGTEFGDQLSAYHHGFGFAQNGYRIVFGPFTYGYINDQTYAKVAGDYPVIGRKKSTYGSSRRRRGFVRTLVEGIVNTTRRFLGKSPINSYPSSNYNPNDINIVESGSGFEEGYAIICLYQLQNDSQYDSLALTDNFYVLRYNYIDTTGRRMDKLEYEECQPFHNGYAWVKYDSYYYLIDETGKRQKKYRFNAVHQDDNGYYMVRYHARYGIINPDYEQVVPCEHSVITFEDGNYIETYFSEKTVIYELPNSDSD